MDNGSIGTRLPYDGTSWTKVKCKFTKQRQSPGNDRDHVVIMKQTTINGHKTGITMHLHNKSWSRRDRNRDSHVFT